MQLRNLAVVVVAVGFILVGGARADEGVAKGEENFLKYCSSCHGADGRGDGPVASTLDPKPADLTRIAARRDGTFPDIEIRRIIDGREPVRAHGAKQMPVWGKVFRGGFGPGLAGESKARGTAWMILRYLKTIQVE